MRHAFAFDASACTGCKACQVACKDKNQLPAGVLWRRVYEVSGGGWEQHGAAWTNSVFAYNVSMGCNHCADPVCAAACPTGAYEVRDDGIVWQRAEKCIGCEYCVWACPYGAPQYSAALGRTTKCDFCVDLIDEASPPACVAACPMRALDIVERQSQAEVLAPFPLPAASRTQPGIEIKPHRAMLNGLPRAVANYEEVRPALASGTWPLPSGIWHRASRIWHLASGTRLLAPGRRKLHEWPLVAFTLFGQAAAGVACLTLFAGATQSVLILIGLLLGAAALSSLLHLGTAGGAWRAPANLRSSALSREIVMLGLFAAAFLLAWASPTMGGLALAVTAVGLVESMVRVYDLEAIPSWGTWKTRAAFGASALLLGGLALAFLWSATTDATLQTSAIALLTVAVAVQQVASRRSFYLKPAQKVM